MGKESDTPGFYRRIRAYRFVLYCGNPRCLHCYAGCNPSCPDYSSFTVCEPPLLLTLRIEGDPL